ncbi:MAG: hypothetical protein HUU45_08785, partial [Leptospiraceae bacterium]|nr:hypothetical protein [Leptospiraceae bacterium]
QLRCHYCGTTAPNPVVCPTCQSRRIKYFGQGTEQIERILKEEFPEKHIQLKCTNLFSVQIDFFERMQIPDKSLLILDPPRNGAGKNLSTIIRDSNFEEIFYISCNPKTQLEDLKIITESFQLKEFILTDPYPQTPHIESIAYLQKKI